MLRAAPDLEAARTALYDYLHKAERAIFDVDNDLHILEKATVREGVRVLQSIIGPVNEHRTGVSALDCLWKLARGQQEAIKKAAEHRIPFGITPHYLSLMDSNRSVGHDHAVRAQVIPPPSTVDLMASANRDIFDFMGEHDTSPIDLVTRRYPFIAILKPFNTCAQICVYCQRNWEIDEVLDQHAMAARKVVEQALDWFDDHQSVGDVLITGGDPMIMADKQLHRILETLSQKRNVYRIRIGTRTPVVLPQRWTPEVTEMIASFRKPGRREIAVVTHFEHSYEITPDSLGAVDRIRRAGISVYNQQVFTVENSRRFETAKLRRDLKSIGVDPYYTFNMKGKEETRPYMVPIARILQERKEEARLLREQPRLDHEPLSSFPRRRESSVFVGEI